MLVDELAQQALKPFVAARQQQDVGRVDLGAACVAGEGGEVARGGCYAPFVVSCGDFGAEDGLPLPICVQTSSVRAPMNWGVALRSLSWHWWSTNWPMLYQRADLRRWGCVSGTVDRLGRKS